MLKAIFFLYLTPIGNNIVMSNLIIVTKKYGYNQKNMYLEKPFI